MIDYNNLNSEEKRALRDALNVERINLYYLEDNGILLMEAKELFEYIYLYDVKKLKDAINLLNKILEKQINSSDVNKSIIEKILEDDEKVIKISNNVYAYKER